MGWEYVRHGLADQGGQEGNTEFLALFHRTDEAMPWPEPPPEKATDRYIVVGKHSRYTR